MAGLVGRESVSALLRRAWAGAASGRGRLLLLAGEPGIGKTALAVALTDHVTAQGATAAWGVCSEAGGVPAFWPWPDIVERFGATLPQLSADRESAWFDCATAVVRAVRQNVPALVVLDDLQWAGAGALRVLDFVVRQLVRDNALVLGTYRDTGVDPSDPLSATIASAEVVALGGLGVGEVARMLDGVPDPDRVAAEVQRRTGGNPFFVEQIARLLASGGPAASQQVPAAVGEAVGRRLARLPQSTADLLDLAAVGGIDVDAVILARAADLRFAEVTTRLAAAVTARILRTADAVGRYRFEHDLYREARLAALDDATLARTHLAYARALEAEPGAPIGQVAYHYARAVPAADPVVARERVEAAAASAAARHAYEEAARLRHDAVRLAELDGPVPPQALLDLGDALLDSGEPAGARDAYLRVTARTGDAEMRARAALGVHRAGVESGSPRTHLIGLLESVSLDGILGARVRAALARELADGPGADPQRARSLAASAVHSAAADPGTLAACLLAQHDVEWAPGTAALRLDLVARMIEAADRAGEVAIAGEGAQLRFAALAEVADPSAPAALDELSRRATRPRLRYLAASRRAAYELLTGSADEAMRLAEAARELGEAIGEPDTAGVYATQTVTTELVRGGPAGMGAVMRAAGAALMPPELLPHQRMFELLAAGEHTAAAALLRATTGTGEAMYRWRAVARAALEVEIAAAADALDVCPPLYRYLRPYAGQMVLIGGAVAILPPIDLYLGLAAPDVSTAAGHFREAIAITERLGARGYAARARVELATLAPSDPGAIGGLGVPPGVLREAAETADELGHYAVRERALALLSAPAAGPAEFRRRGEIWTLAYDGSAAQVPDAKGLHDIARLLAAPGQEISAQELAGDPTPDTGSDEILDETAKAAYKSRLAQLDADIDEATADHDAGRLGRATAEREALVAALAQAYGLGGRARRLKDPGERARTAVTARIRDAIRRIEAVHPALAAHLRGALQTGRRCSYRPQSPIRWTL